MRVNIYHVFSIDKQKADGLFIYQIPFGINGFLNFITSFTGLNVQFHLGRVSSNS